MATSNSSGNLTSRGYSTKKIVIIIIVAFAILALIWILMEARADKPDVPASGTVGQIIQAYPLTCNQFL